MISVLNRAAGFFSQFFFTMNHYIYCKKRRINFRLDTTDWTFSYQNGWIDYFKPFDLVFDESAESNERHGHGTVLEEVSYKEYGNVLKEVYQYNDFIKGKISEKMEELCLLKGAYESIFIRRGDKLLCESKYLETEEYIKTLLRVCDGSTCRTIFLQTDDYQAYIDIQTFIEKNGLDIRVLTLCKPDLFGFTMSGIEFYKNPSDFSENQPYINRIREMNVQNKIIFDLNKEEMLDHMITFLVGVDIVLQSRVCVTDYSSNVGRFIKLWKGESVYTAYKDKCQYHEAGKELDLEMMRCPSY